MDNFRETRYAGPRGKTSIFGSEPKMIIRVLYAITRGRRYSAILFRRESKLAGKRYSGNKYRDI